MLAAAGPLGVAVLFSSGKAGSSSPPALTSNGSKRYAKNDSNVVVVPHGATGEEVHEALCGVLVHVASNGRDREPL